MRLYQVDAFASKRFTGNPAIVCLLDMPREDTWMQAFASEMNLSETAFVESNDSHYGLRWFTPSIEVDLCGHATLASAHILWETGATEANRIIEFNTRSGYLSATCEGDWIQLDFPATPPKKTTCNIDLERALGVTPIHIGKSIFDFLVEVSSEEVVRGINPDLSLIGRAAARGVIVTAESTSDDYDFVSRFFSPQSGVAEDPVTGSAHCCLAPYWAHRMGKNELVGYQASPRGGTVRVRLRNDRVVLGGQAVTVFGAEMLESR